MISQRFRYLQLAIQSTCRKATWGKNAVKKLAMLTKLTRKSRKKTTTKRRKKTLNN
jgi:hypothetical protein